MEPNQVRDTVINRGICTSCNEPVPVSYRREEKNLYLVKHCKDCGETSALISSDADNWQAKRDVCGHDHEERSCTLRCTECQHPQPPTLVFLDVTNRCNMNCPICMANITSMGFKFDPPMDYFDRIFRHLAQFDPKPKIQLFGGEPTVRNDIIDIIKLAASYGLMARVVTNGLRLADEDFCRDLLATRTQVIFAFDGRDPETYRRIRKDERVLEKKLKALDMVRRYQRKRISLMVCVGKGVNDHKVGDLIEFCHERRDSIASAGLIPLVETWGPEQVDAENTTTADVERFLIDAVPGTEFLPGALLHKLSTLRETFNFGRITFSGSHPNCESLTVLISDGKRYQPLSYFMKVSADELARQGLELDAAMEKKFRRSLIARLFGNKGRRAIYVLSGLRLALRCFDMNRVIGDKRMSKAWQILKGLAQGKRLKMLLPRYTNCKGLFRIGVLPFEEPANIESCRLVDCPATFAYEHPVTQQIGLMPVCSWGMYKDAILRATSERYGTARDVREECVLSVPV